MMDCDQRDELLKVTQRATKVTGVARRKLLVAVSRTDLKKAELALNLAASVHKDARRAQANHRKGHGC